MMGNDTMSTGNNKDNTKPEEKCSFNENIFIRLEFVFGLLNFQRVRLKLQRLIKYIDAGRGKRDIVYVIR